MAVVYDPTLVDMRRKDGFGSVDAGGNITFPGAVKSKGMKKTVCQLFGYYYEPDMVEGCAYVCDFSGTQLGVILREDKISSAFCPTLEVWVEMPATAKTIEFAGRDTVIWWDDGTGAFAAGNPAPDMSAGNTTYVLVFRWDGVRWLGNLAYKVAAV